MWLRCHFRLEAGGQTDGHDHTLVILRSPQRARNASIEPHAPPKRDESVVMCTSCCRYTIHVYSGSVVDPKRCVCTGDTIMICRIVCCANRKHVTKTSDDEEESCDYARRGAVIYATQITREKERDCVSMNGIVIFTWFGDL